MPVIKNDGELLAILGTVIEDVINNVSDKAIQLLRDDIEKYAVNQPSDWYERTNEFENAFRWDDLAINLTNFSRRLFYDPTTMATYDANNFIHGSPFTNGGDARDNLADILNVENYTSSLHWKLSHPYWDIFVSQLIDGGQLDVWFKEELRSVGLNIF
jgi:hypothetical protein